jgi:hypothetical protein
MWDLKLDNDGQPIMPKQVRCIENIVGNVDKKFAWLGKHNFLVIGETYDVLPYPHKLSKSEAKSVLGKNGLLFMKFKGQKMKMYINKNYFEPL